MKREQRLPVLAVSRGIGVGRVVFLQNERRKYFRLELDPEQIQLECERLRSAMNVSVHQLRELSTKIPSDTALQTAEIFDAHLLILESFSNKIEAFIKKERVNSEWAIRTIGDEFIKKQERVSDIGFRDKYLDIEDVSNRLLQALNGSQHDAQIDPDSIAVARELTPSAIVQIAKKNPAAIITEHGGWTSHSAILARQFHLPMVSGVRNLRRSVGTGDIVIVDGSNGEIIINPSAETTKRFKELGLGAQHPTFHHFNNSDAITTTDGVPVVIRANVDTPHAYETAKNKGALGVGLYRSESLIKRPGAIPTEGEQFAAYGQIADAAGADGVRIRTFDVGVERLNSDPHWRETNPALGLRAIRLSLADPTHFRTQIRAILRAAFGRKIDIVLPMVSGVDEITRSKVIIEEERARLKETGFEIGESRLGAMIETPSAVLTAFEIAKRTDFLCIGTNDLVQYLLAIDRDNHSVADWYQTLHPAVLIAIDNVLSTARDAKIPVSICGEMAGSPFYAPVLLGLGAHELSMNPSSIPPVLRLLSGIAASDAVALVEEIRSLATAEETEDHLRHYYHTRWVDLFPPNFLNSRFR